MKKILIIASEFPPGPGGIGQHIASFMLALATTHDVHVLANQDYASAKEIETYLAQLPQHVCFSVFAKRQGKTTSVKRIAQVMRLVAKERPEVVFVSGRFPLWIGALLKIRFPKTRVEGFVHGTEITLTGGILSEITRCAYAKLDRIIAVSHFTKSLLHSSIPESKIIVVPNGLDAQFLEISKNAQFEKLPWVGKPKLLTVGNLTPRKGQHRVVVALPTILKVFPEAHYHIVGLPTDAPKIKALAEKLGVGHAITIHGRMASRADLYRAYASADVFVMLSENQKNGDLEGFGIAILEANAFGLSAIGATGCGIDDAISLESGVLVDGNNATEIAQALQHMVAHKDAYTPGARRWAENHNWDELVKFILPVSKV